MIYANPTQHYFQMQSHKRNDMWSQIIARINKIKHMEIRLTTANKHHNQVIEKKV